MFLIIDSVIFVVRTFALVLSIVTIILRVALSQEVLSEHRLLEICSGNIGITHHGR